MVYFLILSFIIEIPIFNENSADPDQMASDPGLHCLPVLHSFYGTLEINNRIYPAFANSVDPGQLASEEAN